VALWKALEQLYRSIAVSTSLEHLLPIDSTREGVRKSAMGSKSTLEIRFSEENSRKELKRNEN
jgi:hypothetical protein